MSGGGPGVPEPSGAPVPAALPEAAGSRRVVVLVGTRPEVMKLAPVVRAVNRTPGLEAVVCSTGQHRELLDPALAAEGLRPRYDLEAMAAGCGPSAVAAAVLERLPGVLAAERPEWLLVQGDTTSAVAGAMAAFYQRVPVAHVEAGLRSGRIDAPWPEEANRRLVAVLAALHFAPTVAARDHLVAEGVDPERVHVTGNTAVDALEHMRERLAEPPLRSALAAEFSWIDPSRRLLLVTAHRRESLPGGFAGLCHALRALAARGDVQVVFPMHLNPEVRARIAEHCGAAPGLHRIEPLDYPRFVYLLERCHFVITDSGGVQEEAPSLGKPVLVAREVTERPEAIAVGAARLVGTRAADILATANRLLDSEPDYRAMTGHRNPFGDGHAAERIARLLAGVGREAPVQEWCAA